MAKKIKLKKDENLSEADQKAQEEAVAAEAARDAQGIQDEFQAKGFELVEWVQEKQGLVLGLIAVVVLAGLGYGIYTVVQHQNDEKASVDYAKALIVYQAPLGEVAADADGSPTFKDATARATEARKLFTAVTTNHKGTGAATLASLYVGHTALKLGDADAAIAAYQTFLSETDKKDPLRFAGLSGLAAAQEAKGDKKAAIAALEELVALPDAVDEDGALLALGRLHQDEGNTQKATEAWQRLGKDFPESPLKARADELLTLAGVAPTPAADIVISPESGTP